MRNSRRPERRRAGFFAMSPRRALENALVAAFCLALVPAVGAETVRAVPEGAAAVRLSFAPVVAAAGPAVVSVTTEKRIAPGRDAVLDDPLFSFFRGFGRERPRAASFLGSGVIVRGDGLIVTNAHVVEDADAIRVMLADRREFAAELVETDKRSDLAFLRIKAGADLSYLRLGASDDLQVGDLILAIGNPFGIGQIVTSGIVSAEARSAPDAGDVAFIQTDAAVNPGNSGGALVALDGTLVGINTAIFTRSGGSIGIGFAIPADLVRARITALDKGGGTARAWPGLNLAPLDARVAASLGLERPEGLAVVDVYPKGAAARAGSATNDVVLAVDGVEVADTAGFNYRLSLEALGGTAKLRVRRDGRVFEASLPLEAPPKDPPPEVTDRSPLNGAAIANLSPGLNDEIGRGLAGRYGLRPGDVERALRRGGGYDLVIRRDGRLFRFRAG